MTANHPFVDGNKRTALVSTVAFYAVNGYSLEYGNEIRSLLKRLATDESSVPIEEIVEYLETNIAELHPPRSRPSTMNCFLSPLVKRPGGMIIRTRRVRSSTHGN